jgi:ubiquinone/menaquinone biosynthesis C-methylase UbiE
LCLRWSWARPSPTPTTGSATSAALVENFRRYSAPNATLYDTVTALLFGGFFGRVATELAELAPRGEVPEVGSGPGRLAARLAELAPGVQVTSVDISPEMVERANSLAARSGVAGRVEFRVGDVALLPLPDASFDAVVSTFSLHHWQSPAKGLEEIYRVLRPGGVARIYDVVDWIRRFEQGGPNIVELAKESPFGERGAFRHSITARFGAIPLVYRAELLKRE